MSVRFPALRAVCVTVLVLLLAATARVATAQIDHTQHQQPSPAGLMVPHEREASGTAWQPDATPMYAVHGTYGEWEWMGHGSLFLQYLRDSGLRGHEQFGSINWAMGMARRPVARGRLGVRSMLSLEPWTIGGCGYPDLLASGEFCDEAPIVDRQHPHDLFMELAAQYDQPINDSIGFEVYGGLSGEPALGPVAFPHRLSAMPNPLAPLSHHWMDATHITHGVLTGGVYGREWKVEGSLFNGREPDDRRWDFDFGAFDSFSARIWYLPADTVAIQVSAGHLEEAEEGQEGQPRTDVDRVTASVTWLDRFRDGGSVWASTVAWGRNREEDDATSFFLVEANVTFDEQDAWFGRAEVGRKTAHDLDIGESDETFTLGKLQAGYVRYFETWHSLKPGIGATLSLSLAPNALDAIYDQRATLGFGVFLTLRPAVMTMR